MREPLPVTTPWTDDVNPNDPLPEHPRPQLRRSRWQSLNGWWEYTSRTGAGPVRRDQHILVPYPPESLLSGVGRRDEHMWYRRTFRIPQDWWGSRILLHFGAVDQKATVWVNHQLMAVHEGGYTAFDVEITQVLRSDAEQEVVIRADDAGNAGTFPVGKQANDPGGILYTGVSGVWQTVWLEPVGDPYVETMAMATDTGGLDVTPRLSDDGAEQVEVVLAESDGAPVAHAVDAPGECLRLNVAGPRLWSPEDPYLYDVTVRVVGPDGTVQDEVSSYAGLRTVAVLDDDQARPRIAVNSRITFLHAVLDQGYWPDGLYTAPTDEALRYDIEQIRALGFNSVRKHVKIEPARWYYWTDRMGLLVWQDMPSLPVILDNPPGPQGTPVARARERFEAELDAMLDQLGNITSIVVWVPFNEGWGEYDTARIAERVKAVDPHRLVIAASGVNCCHSHPDSGAGDVYDDHTYVGPGRPTLRDARPIVDGEYGGVGLAIEGHEWSGTSMAYEMVADRTRLTERYLEVMHELDGMIRDNGLSGAVYTQITDVENEVNGLLTYDRRVCKVSLPVVAERNRALIETGRF